MSPVALVNTAEATPLGSPEKSNSEWLVVAVSGFSFLLLFASGQKAAKKQIQA